MEKHIRLKKEIEEKILKIKEETNETENQIINRLIKKGINDKKQIKDKYLESVIKESMEDAYKKYAINLEKQLKKIVHENNVTFLLIQSVEPFLKETNNIKKIWNEADSLIKELDYQIEKGKI